jgi:hypothetical protein
VRDNDQIILESLYRSVVNENANLDQWVTWFNGKEIANLPVSWSGVETETGSKSYGGNVTFDSLMQTAKTNYPTNPTEILKRLSSQLQDYIIGLQEDKGVIDQNTASGLITMFQNPNNVKYFLDRYKSNQITSPKELSTDEMMAMAAEEEKSEPIGLAIKNKSPQEASLLIKGELQNYLRHVETEEDKQKIMTYLNQSAPFDLDPNDGNRPKDPELQKLMMAANMSRGNIRHLMSPRQRQEVDKRNQLSQEYRKLTQHSPDKNMSIDELEKLVNDMKK